MLSPSEFIAGTIEGITAPALILPRTSYETAALVMKLDDRLVGIELQREEYLFHAWTADRAEDWSGVIVPDVRIEVDETSAFNPQEENVLGAAIRKENQLAILTLHSANRGFQTRFLVPVVSDLPACAKRYSVGFRRWQIVLGEGLDKRVLKEVEAAARQ
ncbi:hypothetical protein [Sphingomonas asaccharolytica]|uniref:hypothetical protein n=1 Tax=Sphingomonas asaccharolytica TaxID=40681 RepID=UPI00083206C8|nr:hypothetical protein [Sphingomonas asaccharolytica]